MKDTNTNITENVQDLVKKINMNIRQVMLKELDNSHLTMHQVFIMKVIKKNPKTNLTALSSQLNLAKSSVSLTVNKLVDEGYLLRIENPADRRNIYFALSEKGEEVFSEMWQKSRGIFANLTAELTHEELLTIEESLSKLSNYIEKAAKTL